jgi:adenosylcobinamide kinase/adenosylcobinamide-phosphate guanylyltransferase
MTSANSDASSDQLILITGPARSGKSEWAETLAAASGQAVVYVATAQVDSTDLEWQNRIQAHRYRRPQHWTTLQVPVDLSTTIQQASTKTCLLVDSLGTWLANILDQDESSWEQTLEILLHSLEQTSCTVILVAEEVGWGVVPAYPVGRTFRDRLGSLVRGIGAIANPVYLVTSGYVLNLSTLGFPLAQKLNRFP